MLHRSGKGIGYSINADLEKDFLEHDILAKLM